VTRAAPPTPRSHRVARAFAATATLLIAAWGAVTGTIAWLEQREVSLRIAPDVYPAAGPEQPIHLSIANPSRRGVTILGGAVSLDGRRIGGLDSVTPDTRADWREVPLDDLLRSRRPLPVSVSADGTFSGAFFWRAERGVPDQVLEKLRAEEDPALAHENESRIAVDVRLAVRLDIEPGDDPEVDVPVVRPRFARGPSVTSPVFDYELRRSRVTAVIAQFPPSFERAVLSLRLWSRDSTRPVRVVTRPLIVGPVRFPLGRLRRGSYGWALENRGQTYTGEFDTPCDARPRAGSGGIVPADRCFTFAFGP
jgi:hypothetical protein